MIREPSCGVKCFCGKHSHCLALPVHCRWQSSMFVFSCCVRMIQFSCWPRTLAWTVKVRSIPVRGAQVSQRAYQNADFGWLRQEYILDKTPFGRPPSLDLQGFALQKKLSMMTRESFASCAMMAEKHAKLKCRNMKAEISHGDGMKRLSALLTPPGGSFSAPSPLRGRSEFLPEFRPFQTNSDRFRPKKEKDGFLVFIIGLFPVVAQPLRQLLLIFWTLNQPFVNH